MRKLTRITSEYVDVEDRIRITALTEDNTTIGLWFTLRLMDRIVNHCLSLLEKHCPEITKAAITDKKSRANIQGFVQQSAQQELQQEEAVSLSESSPDYLVREVDIKFIAEGAILIFKKEETENFELHLNNQQLRQWLGIIFALWKNADWPLSSWPDWMIGSGKESHMAETSVH